MSWSRAKAYPLRSGQPVSFSRPAFQYREGVTASEQHGSSAGKVDAIVPVKNPVARTFLVRVVADAADGQDLSTVTPGMSVRGRLNLGAARAGVVAPRDAVLKFADGRVTVWVIDTAGEQPVVRERRVVTGLEFDGRIEIRSGLEDGDIVVTRGNETLQEGQTVTVLERGG